MTQMTNSQSTNNQSMFPAGAPVLRTRRRTLRSVALAVVLGLSGAALTAITPVSAAPSAVDPYVTSSSPAIAASAQTALAAHERWISSGAADALAEFTLGRDGTAQLTATELGLDPVALTEAWRSAAPAKQVVVLAALSQLGVPYRSRASAPGEGFDCSGLVHFAWSQVGIDLPRSSGTQIRAVTRVERELATAGDLVHYPGHVMLYLGIGDAIVHSPYRGRTVEIRFITERRSVTFGDPLG